MQIGLAQRSMQARVARVGAERFSVLLQCIFPTATLEQEVTEKAVSPRRLTVQMRSPKCQTGSEIQVFVPEFEPRLRLVGVKLRDLAELLSRASEVFLALVARSQRLVRLAVGRIEL